MFTSLTDYDPKSLSSEIYRQNVLLKTLKNLTPVSDFLINARVFGRYKGFKFSPAIFSFSKFEACYFINCSFSNTVFENCFFNYCFFDNCFGLGTNVKNTIFESCTFKNTAFEKSWFVNLFFNFCTFEDAKIYRTIFKKIQSINRQNANNKKTFKDQTFVFNTIF
jgi:hypothetical protein